MRHAIPEPLELELPELEPDEPVQQPRLVTVKPSNAGSVDCMKGLG